MSELRKISFHALSAMADRPIVLFGSGNIAEKTLRRLGAERIAFIADNSTNLQGGTFLDLEVRAPATITAEQLVVICTTDLRGVGEQLGAMGFTAGRDFVPSPLLNDLLAIAELEELRSEFYFTSGTMAAADVPYGGGLYRCAVAGSGYEVERVYSGACYGAIREGSRILFVDTDRGVMGFEGGEVELLGELPRFSRAHGLSMNEELGRYYVSCSKLDEVIELDETFAETRRFSLSSKAARTGEPMHHVNDNCAVGNSLYVSMFSSTGSWKQDVFDGCIAEFDIASGERLRDVARDLYMPHNVRMLDGALHVLDSLPGHLRFGNLAVQGTFPAFTRGLDYAGGLYFLGQSKNRNYSRVIGISNNVSIDCGVIVFNPDLKVSRFLRFAPEIGELHSIVVTGAD